MYPSLILIGGNKFGAGKDTIGEYLVRNYGYRRYSFGDILKTEVKLALYDEEYRASIWDTMPEITRNALLTCLALVDLDPFVKPTSQNMRHLLQVYGTEFRRNCTRDDYWVAAMQNLLATEKPKRAVITDQRFMNEWYWGGKLHGESWYVSMRDDSYAYSNKELIKHESEGSLEGLPHDFYLYNPKTNPPSLGIVRLQSLVRMRMLSYEDLDIGGLVVPIQRP